MIGGGVNGERYSYCGANPLANWDSAGLSWFHVFVPWSAENPIRRDAYASGGMSKVTEALNPVYHAVVGYYNEVQASLKGCPWWSSFEHGLEGVAGVIGTVTLVMPGSELGAVGTSSGSSRLSWLAGEEGYIGRISRPMTADQRALKELVSEVTHGGRKALSWEDAKTIIDWCAEVGYPGFHASPSDLANPSHWAGGPHMHVPGAGSRHIPVLPGGF